MGKQYCCICSNFRGKSLGQGTVSLHRLPSDKYVRSLWVRRLKLVRRDLSVTKHTEICSVHFVGGKGPSDKNDIPSVFPKKTFTASKINQVQPSSNCDSKDDASEPSAELHQINQESGDQSPTNFIQRERSNDVVSLMLHDYCCEPVPEENISTFRYMSTQTEQKDCRTLGTQTDEGFLLALDPVKTSSTMTQTTEESTPEFVSQAIQVQMPDISYYDVKDDPDLLNFYTGIDSSSFKCIFSELSEIHDVETPSSSTGRPKSLSLIDELVRRDLSVTKHTEICSVHFVGGKGPSDKNDIPSVFPKKTFTASKINQVQPSSNCDSKDDASEPSAELHQINQESGDQSPTNFIQRERSNDVVSLMLHDYCCEPVPEENISTFRYMSTQTEQKDCRTLGTQTDEGFLLALDPVKTSSTMTQTTEESTPEFVSQAIQVQMPDISYYDVKDDPDLLNFYTGIDSSSFKCIFSELSEIHDVETPSSSTGRPKSLSLIDEFFLVLMRLRLGLLIVDLSKRFHISKSCCADIISKWIDLLYNNLSFLITWPSRDTINITMPKSFKDLFPSTRVVIDCTELYTEKPYSLSKQSQMYSHYKSHMTYKSLISVTPNGVVSFVSDLWSGSISDMQITVQSGLLDLCESGDGIMADKGFTISDLTTARAMYLIIPPRKQKRKQLSAIEIEQTRRIANLRIHVERHMERVKNFRILQGIIPITISKSVNKIWKICNALTCLLPPLYPHQTENDEDNNILFDETFIQEQ